MQKTDNNLDLYINGSKFNAGKLPVEQEIIEQLFSILPEIDKDCILKIAEKKEYVKSRCFFQWLQNYAENIKKTFNKTKHLCDMDIDGFRELAGYCLYNLILHNNANKHKFNVIYDNLDISMMASIMDRYFRDIFYDDYTKKHLNHEWQTYTKLPEQKIDILWELYLQEEEALWRKYSMKLQVNISRNLEDLLDILTDIESDG